MGEYFHPITSGIAVLILILFAVAVRYKITTGDQAAATAHLNTYYGHFTNVSIMIFIGFGFLMTFLKRYGFSAVGFNFLLSCIVFLWNILCAGFWENVASDAHDSGDHIELTMPLFIEGLFGAGAVMISFGAVLGRVSPTQLVVMAFLEVLFYSFNFYIGAWKMEASDSGGSMFVHTWGAYFGLAVSIAIGKFGIVRGTPSSQNPAEASRTTSDLTAMIGTIFLWIYWPSFNGALASDGAQLRVIFNTVISLCGSCIATFLVSSWITHDRKFDMVHVQNSTLAGGVAIGTGANLFTQPAGALFVGMFAGVVSVVGYEKLSDKLAKKLGMLDTCGVHNLHGIPGVIGGLSGILLAATAQDSDYGGRDNLPFSRVGSDQMAYQFYALITTLAMAILCGFLTGFIMSKLPSLPKQNWHEDDAYWGVADDYRFVGAKRGEQAARGSVVVNVVSPTEAPYDVESRPVAPTPAAQPVASAPAAQPVAV